MTQLKLPLDAVPEARRLEIKSEIDVRRYAEDEAPVAVRGLRAQNIMESAYYKYHLAAPEGATYKLKLTIYADADSRRAAWERNYPLALLDGVQDRDWGDTGFILPGRAGAFGLGRVIAHVQAGGGAPALEAVLDRLHERARRLAH